MLREKRFPRRAASHTHTHTHTQPLPPLTARPVVLSRARTRTCLHSETVHVSRRALCHAGLCVCSARWERYCRGVNAIVYVVDAAGGADQTAVAREELHDLMSKPTLAGVPLLVLGNKNDLEGSLKVPELIDNLELNGLRNREVCCYSISCKNQDNIDITLDWLTKHAR